MFGIGGLGKIAGGLMNKIGLGKVAPFVSAGINALTGNWAGVAMDVAGLANRLTGGKLGFLNKVAQFAPLASAFTGGGNIGDIFKNGGLKGLVDKFKNVASNFKNLTNTLKGAQQGFQQLRNGNVLGGASKILKAFEAVDEFLKNKDLFNARSADQHRELGFRSIIS